MSHPLPSDNEEVARVLRVLHVDDWLDDRTRTKRFLNIYDPFIKLVSVSSPEEALQQLDQRFDCILSDYRIPQLKVIEFARKVRELSNIPFIIYTGNGSEEVASEAFQTGVDDYIKKEFEKSHYSVLANRIRAAVKKYRAERELIRSGESLKEAERIACLGNWDWHINDNAWFWSDEIYRIFGLEPQEVEATYEAFIASVHPDDRKYVKKSLDEALKKNQPYNIDLRIVLSNGNVRYIHEQAEIHYDDCNTPIRMIGIVQDITDRKKMEEELRLHVLKLSKMVEERTWLLKEVEAKLDEIVKTYPILIRTGNRQDLTEMIKNS